MYLPQWLWLLPAIAMFPLAVRHRRQGPWLLACCAVVVVGPLMGLQWSFGKNAGITGASIRVMTYNVQLWAYRNIDDIIAEIDAADPDILCLQDAGRAQKRLAPIFRNRYVAAHEEYVIASRFPITSHSIGDISYDGETHTYLRATLKIGGKSVSVATAHLLTSRAALSAFRSASRWFEGIAQIQHDFDNRLAQARRLANDLRDVEGPLVIAGDLNVPATSLVLDTLKEIGARSAFDESGRGYGYTFGHATKLQHSFVRIDHILISNHFVATRTVVGSAEASDHRPVIADLILRED
jgi:endonuclease/exonuclease/phosphatase (EEP) superfamily protein YafD